MQTFTSNGTFDLESKASTIIVSAAGTFGGASVDIGFTLGGTFRPLVDLQGQTTAFDKRIDIGQSIQLQARITGAGGSTSIDVADFPF